ncbi:MAG: hypothetical protein ABSB18_05980 [Candidatus Omnitrophota bacterium]
MEESLRNRLVIIFAILSALFFIVAVGSCSANFRMTKLRDVEMGKRLDIEEKLSKISQQGNLLTEKLKAKEKELDDEKAAHQAVKKALVQEQLVDQSLKEELEKVTKLKETLEEDLKDALAGGKSKVKAK